MKVSVVIAVLNSHEVVRRQIIHFRKMDLPNDVEFIFVDDGSNPPLGVSGAGLKNFCIYYTHDKRPWTQGLARNLGASKAQGEYLFFTDIDHIITKEALTDSLIFTGDKMVFVRYYGILSPEGDIICDEESMLDFGLDPKRIHTRRGHMCGGIHGNTYLVRKSVFDLIGGYDPRFCESGFHVGGKFPSEESRFNQKYNHLVNRGMAKNVVIGPKIYCYPVSRFRADGDNNPFGLFHGLSLEQVPQPMKA
jgi:glycosyltransferase involved in cell wall biosynthesis